MNDTTPAPSIAQPAPGPWQAHQFGGAKVGVFPPTNPYQVEDAWSVFTYHEGQFVPVASYVRAADAPLIAAAPHLLEALSMAKLIVTAYDAFNEATGRGPVKIDGRVVRDFIDAAIAKAEGRS